MTWFNGLQLLAMLLSPLIALRVSTWLERRRSRRDRQTEIFRALMATRAQVLTPRHVDALNTIDVEFSAASGKEKVVRLAWKEYLDSLEPTTDPGWPGRRQERFVDLMFAMSRCLGYDMDRTHLKNVAYHPSAFVDRANEEIAGRRALIALAEGRVAIPVRPINAGPAPAADNAGRLALIGMNDASPAREEQASDAAREHALEQLKRQGPPG